VAYWEDDPRALGVLERALQSASGATRMRGVAMLAHVACESREMWLQSAASDSDVAVAQTALAVMSWVIAPTHPSWPQREDPRFDRVDAPPAEVFPWTQAQPASRWKWEYVVEIWRDDGLLIGCYLAATCAEDDEHAKRIALGQAILANAGGRGDVFDAGTAAAFIVAKRRLAERSDASGHKRRGSGTERMN